MTLAIAAGAAMAASSSLAQQPSGPSASGPAEADNPFFQSRIPEDFKTSFVCHQAGTKTVELEGVSSFAPRKIEGVMTFSVITADGTNHLLYLGGQTTCRLAVTPPN